MSHETVNPTTSEPQEPAPALLAHGEDAHGSMSLVAPDRRLQGYIRDSNTAELVDFRLEEDDKALLNGQRLLSVVERQARERGIHWLIATSGPVENKMTTDFFDAVFGKSVAMDDDYDGPNFGRRIWFRKVEPRKD
ncbi:MAG TPA: hypothetical protein VN031_04095 [Candidatus Microsaccharimonas sp.]|nr:hypothetical protein [Candidatus Microsaccharimonas sp.]